MTPLSREDHPSRPNSIAQLRAVSQPPEVRLRANAEHWTASLYLRNISPYLTWMLLKTSISANGVTGLMILVGWSTAAALLIPGIGGAALALVLGQLQMLVDCSDGEVARWRNTRSPAGVFLNKVGHYTTEALIPIALGIRAAGWPLEFPEDFAWTTAGFALALVIVLNKALNDMVHVARANAGLEKLSDRKGEAEPSQRVIARLRKAGRTVVVIAHRRAVLASVNRVLVLKDGKQAAFGSPEKVFGTSRKIEKSEAINDNRKSHGVGARSH